MKKLLKYAILVHRFLGIAVCLFFGLWFASGIVMMYARMPELTEAKRLARLPALELGQVNLSVVSAAHGAEDLQRFLIGMLSGRPVYRILDGHGKWITVFAEDGRRLAGLSPREAVAAAAQFSQIPPEQLHWTAELTDVDQWTVYPASRPYLPFELIRADDKQGSRYYVSSATGAVYLSTTSTSRAFAWLGAIPHWWYIRALRANTPLWRVVMIVSSGIGVVMCFAGMIAGILRYSPSKKYRFRGVRRSSLPHTGMKRWHYVLGYCFGVVTFTWIFSGLMTMNPGKWSPGPEPSLEERQAFAGGVLRPELFHLSLEEAGRILAHCLSLKEMELIQVDGHPYYLGRGTNGQAQLVSADQEQGACLSTVPMVQILAASRSVGHGADLLDVEVLDHYDSYYYDRHDIKPLPVIRLRLQDGQGTWLYVNPRTGLLQARYTGKSRLERWLYNGLHSLDFPFLYHHRPVWDLTVILLSIGGLALSLTGIYLSSLYLCRSFKRRNQRQRVRIAA